MLDIVKLALRVSTNAFDEEIQMLIEDCLAELSDLGIVSSVYDCTSDPQIKTAVISYCKWHYGDNDTAEKWERIYNSKVARLLHTHGYGLRCDDGDV